MFPNQLHLDLSFDAFSFALDVPTAPFVSWFETLRTRNALSIAEEEGRSERHVLTYWLNCPNCGAGMASLTAVQTTAGTERACRCCRTRFPVE